jgi:hypothetical protein
MPAILSHRSRAKTRPPQVAQELTLAFAYGYFTLKVLQELEVDEAGLFEHTAVAVIGDQHGEFGDA